MRNDTTGIRSWRRAVAGLAIAGAAVLPAAGCGGDDAENGEEITDVDDTQAPVDPTVEPVE